MFHTPCTAGGDMQLHNVCTCSNEEEEEEEHLAKGPKAPGRNVSILYFEGGLFKLSILLLSVDEEPEWLECCQVSPSFHFSFPRT